MAHLIESRQTHCMDDVKEAEQALKKLAKKERQQ